MRVKQAWSKRALALIFPLHLLKLPSAVHCVVLAQIVQQGALLQSKMGPSPAKSAFHGSISGYVGAGGAVAVAVAAPGAPLDPTQPHLARAASAFGTTAFSNSTYTALKQRVGVLKQEQQRVLRNARTAEEVSRFLLAMMMGPG